LNGGKRIDFPSVSGRDNIGMTDKSENFPFGLPVFCEKIFYGVASVFGPESQNIGFRPE
jgi:hypothetical protein